MKVSPQHLRLAMVFTVVSVLLVLWTTVNWSEIQLHLDAGEARHATR